MLRRESQSRGFMSRSGFFWSVHNSIEDNHILQNCKDAEPITEDLYSELLERGISALSLEYLRQNGFVYHRQSHSFFIIDLSKRDV